MEFSINTGILEQQTSDCIVIGVFTKEEGGGVLSLRLGLNPSCSSYLESILHKGDLGDKIGQTVLLQGCVGMQAERILLVNLGQESAWNIKQYRKALAATYQALQATAVKTVLNTLVSVPLAEDNLELQAQEAVQIALHQAYEFNQFKSQSASALTRVNNVSLWVNQKDSVEAERALQQGFAIGRAVNLARDLGNMPPNICTPTYLAQTANRIATEYQLQLEVLEEADMQALGMGSLLSVSKGSIEPPKFIILRYQGSNNADAAPIVLVGKGITFDTGGISLKPGEGMDEMKYDMCGAATVLATLQAAAQMRLPLNVIAVVPTCENMPAGNASKPGDIVTSMAGKTIEILNTDAEGRLILCDALTYVERFNPAVVIDVATLTGACIIALGHVASGLYGNQPALIQALQVAGYTSDDKVWHMPLLEEYKPQLHSNFADLANIGGRPAGSVTAATFLSHFTQNYAWAHLDIAGTAWHSGKQKGATGRPVSLLTHYLCQYAATSQAKPRRGRPAKIRQEGDAIHPLF